MSHVSDRIVGLGVGSSGTGGSPVLRSSYRIGVVEDFLQAIRRSPSPNTT